MNLYDAKEALKSSLRKLTEADIAKAKADRMCILRKSAILLENEPKELGPNEESRLARIREMMSAELRAQHDAEIAFKEADLDASLARVEYEVALRESQ